MINGIIYFLLLFTVVLPTTPANATPSICKEVAAELSYHIDDLDITQEDIDDIYERCMSVESWGTYS